MLILEKLKQGQHNDNVYVDVLFWHTNVTMVLAISGLLYLKWALLHAYKYVLTSLENGLTVFKEKCVRHDISSTLVYEFLLFA